MSTKYLRILHFPLLFVVSGAFATALATPGATLGEAVYKSVSEAVFFVEVLDEKGQPSSLGTAFLIADHQLVTNHHVVQEGKPYLRVGTLRVECTLEKLDPANDLALLRVPASITAQPLTLSSEEPAAGSTIFAIGNPAGLERTISQGLVSGRREIEGQSLLQISAAISPGSSGGPVVNTKGEVVGVAVGYLTEGQNLNFAVPVQAVINLLQVEPGPVPGLDSILRQIAELREERDRLSLEEYEQYRKTTDAINVLLQQGRALAQRSPDRLLAIAEAAEQAFADTLAIEVAREALEGSPAAELRPHRVLATCLWRESWFAKQQEKESSIAEALSHARILVEKSRKPTAGDLVLLANILEATPGQRAEAFSRFQQALAAARQENATDLRTYFRGLVRNSRDLAEAATWFKEIVDHGGAEEFDWTALAQRAEAAEGFGFAGEAWLRAAELEPSADNFCSAGYNFWRAEQPDKALTSLRRCTEIGALKEGGERQLAEAYSAMSAILFDRGVYDQSVTYAKQALKLSSENPWPYLNLSRSLNALGRNLEAVTAAENAIRLSDGKYADMHFALGSAYFKLENWDRAARAFQKAAELDPTDDASAYNVALCMQRQRFYSDAAKWFEEVLKRKPDHQDREEILKKIRILRE